MTFAHAAHETDLLGQAASCLGRYDLEGLAQCYRVDVLLDASVPLWRFQLQGAEAILEAFGEELAPLGELEVAEVIEHRSAESVAVELEVRYHGQDGLHLWREVHLLIGDDEGVKEHRIYCTGIWDPATIARHAIEGTMVRR